MEKCFKKIQKVEDFKNLKSGDIICYGSSFKEDSFYLVVNNKITKDNDCYLDLFNFSLMMNILGYKIPFSSLYEGGYVRFYQMILSE